MENFWDYSVWGFFNILAALLISLLAAHMLKRSIPLLQASLIPASVLGGGMSHTPSSIDAIRSAMASSVVPLFIALFLLPLVEHLSALLTPTLLKLNSVLLHLTIQRIARDAQQLGCAVDVSFGCAQGLGYGRALQLFQV